MNSPSCKYPQIARCLEEGTIDHWANTFIWLAMVQVAVAIPSVVLELLTLWELLANIPPGAKHTERE